MDFIDAPAKQTRLLIYTAVSAVGLIDRSGKGVVLDLDLLEPRRQPSPGAQKQAVAELLAQVMSKVDRVIRAQTEPPPTSPAVLARKAVARGERTEVVLGRERRYAPGPGLETFIEAMVVDACERAEKS